VSLQFDDIREALGIVGDFSLNSNLRMFRQIQRIGSMDPIG
jgi:hypothetical protein